MNRKSLAREDIEVIIDYKVECCHCGFVDYADGVADGDIDNVKQSLLSAVKEFSSRGWARDESKNYAVFGPTCPECAQEIRDKGDVSEDWIGTERWSR